MKIIFENFLLPNISLLLNAQSNSFVIEGEMF